MTIGLFAPLPLAMMIPFMAGQSLMMGEAFGKGFQYGKRKISSMSNEQFNALTADDLGKGIQTDYNAIIPHLGQAVKQSSDFQSLVIKEIIDVIKNLPADIIGGFTGTSNPETTSTAASVYGVSGTITDVRRGAPTRLNEGAFDDVENLIRRYMEATGLADYERAKRKVLSAIKNRRGLRDLNAEIKARGGSREIITSARTQVIKKTTTQSRLQHAKEQAQRSVNNAQARVDDLLNLIGTIRQQILDINRRLKFSKASPQKIIMIKLINQLNQRLKKTQRQHKIATIQLLQFKRNI